MTYMLRRENPTNKAMEIVTEQQFRSLTNGKSVFFTNYSAREGIVIKFTDFTLIVIHSDGPMSATCVDFFDRSSDLRALQSLGSLKPSR